MIHKHLLPVTFCIGLFFVLGYTASVTLAQSETTPTGDPRVAFISRAPGNFEIYTISLTSGDYCRLTFNGTTDSSIAFSSDGRQLAFVSHGSGVQLMGIDGSGLHKLAGSNWPTADGSYAGIQWSPDGSKLAFTSYVGGTTEIFVADADGSNPVQLTDNDYPDYGILWSPDSEQIIFESKRDGNEEIYIMNVDGSDQRNLTNDPARDGALSFIGSTDRLVFYSTRDGQGDYKLYSMDTNGENIQETEFAMFGKFPVWSPSGEQVAYLYRGGTQPNLFIAYANGGEEQNVTHFNISGYSEITTAVWSSDAQSIAFGLRAPGFALYVVNVDGSGLQEISNDDNSQNPVWVPADAPSFLTAVVAPGNGTINGRSGPGTDYPVVDSIENITNRCLVVTGRNEDNSWIRLRNPFSSVETVWVSAPLLKVRGDLADVEVADE